MAQALLEASATPLRFDTPDGEPHTVDLRSVLDEALKTSADYVTLRNALRGDTNLLAGILARMAGRLPHALVLVLDQAEEVFTLARTDEEVADRDQALRMLQRLVDVRADVKLIVSLRTEYYGRLLDYLRAGRRDLTGVRDDLLRDFSRGDLIEAITRPTRETPLAEGQPSPCERYGFRYADGVPEAIADGVLALRSENQDSVLPLVQVICTQLYKRNCRARRKTVESAKELAIELQDLKSIKGVEGGLKAFAEDAMKNAMQLGRSQRNKFRKLMTGLRVRHADGTLTTWMVPRETLKRQWRGRPRFDNVVDRAVAVRLLREDELRIAGNKPQSYIRLGHDALAVVAQDWTKQGLLGKVRKIAKYVGYIFVGMIVLAYFVIFPQFRRSVMRVSSIQRMCRGIIDFQSERYDQAEQKLTEARSGLQQLLASDEKKEKKDSDDTGSLFLINLYLGKVYMNRGHLDAALPLVLGVYQTARDSGYAGTEYVQLLNALGLKYYKQEKWADAGRCSRRPWMASAESRAKTTPRPSQ